MAKIKPLSRADLELEVSKLLQENAHYEEQVNKLTTTIYSRNETIGKLRKELGNRRNLWQKFISLLNI